MKRPPANMIPALERFQRGDVAGAREAALAALRDDPDSVPLHGLAGLLAGRLGDDRGALPHFRRLKELAPGDRANRANLVAALIATGQLDEAAAACGEEGDDQRFLRLGGYVAQQQERHGDAATLYERVVASDPQDFESWNNLANSRAACGDLAGAVEAGVRAVNLRPDLIPVATNLSDILGKAGHDEARQRLMRQAVGFAPSDPAVLLELGLAEAGAGDNQAAVAAFQAAIAADSSALGAYLELGLLFENLNRIDDLATLLDAAAQSCFVAPELDFLRAWLLRRQGRNDEALALAEATPETVNPIRRHQLVAELSDRLNQPARAFAAFEAMNAASVAAKPPPPGQTYRAQVEAETAVLTPEWVGRWAPAAPSDPPAPVFIVGFPRSGTTLLDTLLMNVPGFHILEELPVLLALDAPLGRFDRIADLTTDEVAELRGYYFEQLAKILPAPPGATIIDKNPLHMARMPMIHRLFPDARILFVERHPCDAVLSCFMANFQLNHGMRSFTDLQETARTYDAVFTAWTTADDLLPLDVHFVRYERMVEDLEGEMRAVLAFLGRDFDPAFLDNQASARKREHIRTASYSQVGEPIYRRAAGRWERYRDQLAPVMPILQPWIERLGYSDPIILG